MTADPNIPYRRTGANSWEELLIKVNEVLQNPEPGCDPIPPIELPPECHRWAKSDIREVQDALKLMPTDCVQFGPIPDLWKTSIIEEIEAQLENAWCDCEDEICCEPCPNCGTNISTFLFEFETTDCVDVEEPPPCVSNCAEDELDPLFDQYILARRAYQVNACLYCRLLKELEVLQAQLETLEEQLAVLEAAFDDCPVGPIGDACRSALQAQIDAKEQEIDDKQVEVDDKQIEVNDAQAARDQAKADQLAFGQQAFQAGEDCIRNEIFPNCQALASEGSPTPPAINPDDCDQLPDDCCGCDFFICGMAFSLLVQEERVGSSPFVGPFLSAGSGQYNLDGSPVWSRWSRAINCCFQPQFACASTNCDSFGGDCSVIFNNSYIYRWKISQITASCFEPFNCTDGGPCGENGGGGEEILI